MANSASTPAPASAINSPPVISGAAPSRVEAGQLYDFTPTASDADGDALTFVVQNRPAWASFDARSGRLFGTPGATGGSFADIIITVDDGKSSAFLPPFTIDVAVPTANRVPLIDGIPPTSALQGTAYLFRPAASDADRDALAFAIANRPSWAQFDVSTGVLQGTPGATHIGAYRNIVISVSDGQSSVSLPAFSIAVASSNTAPTIFGTAAPLVQVGSTFSFRPSASDADAGTTLTFGIVNQPAWLQFSSTTGALAGTPAATDAGLYADIVIGVSDGQDAVALPPFAITVNSPPVISGIPPTTAPVGSLYSFAPIASDADGDPLTFFIAEELKWATFSSSGVLSGTPRVADAATFVNVTISVTDGKSLPVFLPWFSIWTPQPNRPPNIFGEPPTSVTVGTQYSFAPTVIDPDGPDTVTFGIQNLPAWATFNPEAGRLDGLPGPDDVGTTSDIVISVQDSENAAASLAPFSIVVLSKPTGTTLLSWIPPAYNDDGSPLTDLAGYKIYWGTSPDEHPNSVVLGESGGRDNRVESLAPNTYFFVMTAFNSAGYESVFSNVATITIQ